MNTIIYIRKSTDVEDKQVYSLEAQERVLLELAEKLNLKITKVYKESKSAKSSGREVFNEMIKEVKKNKIEKILVWKSDRLARNFIDGGLIIDLLQNGLIKEIITPERVYLQKDPPYLLSMEFSVSNQFVRDLSINVKRGNQEKLKQGGWPHNAPFGYKNNLLKKDLILDKEKSIYIKRIFELYASGTESINSISKKVFNEGLKTANEKQMPKSTIARVLKNPFYYGMMFSGGKLYKGNHETLITRDLFNEVQKVFEKETRPKFKKHNFVYSGVFECAGCGAFVTAEKQKEIYIYYHCTGGKRECEHKKNFTREEIIDKYILEKFKEFKLKEDILEIMYLASLEKLKLKDNYNEKVISNIESKINIAEKQESKLLNVFLADNIDKKTYDKKTLEIKNTIVDLKNELEKAKNSSNSKFTFELAKKHLETFMALKKGFNFMENKKKNKMLKKVLSNSKLEKSKNSTNLILQWKSPFNTIINPPKTLNRTSLQGCFFI